MGEKQTTDVRRVVRQARPADVGALVELRALMFAAMGVPGVDQQPWRTSAREWFVDHLDDPGCRIVVVEVAGSVVASAMGTLRDCAPTPTTLRAGDVLINNVATLPGHRRRGHSRAATQAVIDWAAQTGAGRIELLATGEGGPLYRELGFTKSTFPVMRRPIP